MTDHKDIAPTSSTPAGIHSVVEEPVGLKLYRALSGVAGPIASYILKERLKAGKEDPARINERRGITQKSRPERPLIWIHGASVGESLSILPLVKRLNEHRSDLRFLVTTGTVTSADLMAERLPQEAIHQFIPIDHPAYVASFLDHWRPDAALFVESEFWPNLILKARERIPFMAIVNGRVSPKSFDDWRKKKRAIQFMLSAFDVIIAQDKKNAERLTTLSERDVLTFGNLKHAAPALPIENNALNNLKTAVNGRSIWLAASTHPGEEEMIVAAHKILKERFPDLLTILAPRHPQRGDAIAAHIESEGLIGVRRSQEGDAPTNITPQTDVYIADTLGELGLFYHISDISFVGGSLTEKGGHNPLEPARLGGAILHGPHIFNFSETYEEMRGAGGAALVRNDRELATAIRRLLADEKTRVAMSDTARSTAEASAERVLREVSELLLKHLPQKAPSN